MKILVRSIWLCSLVLTFLLPVAHGDTAKDDSAKILILGDSLSSAFGIPEDRGWVALLQQRLDENHYKCTTLNASITGETTSGGANRIADLLERHSPTIVIAELGGNDGLRGLSLKAMRGNLESIVTQSQSAGARVLLLGMRIPENYGGVYTRRFHATFHELAEQYGTALVSFFLADVALDPTLMQDDGIHPNSAAQPLMLNRVWPQLKPLLNTVIARDAQ